MSCSRYRGSAKIPKSFLQEGCLQIEFVLGTWVPGLQDQWLGFFRNSLTEGIPLTDYDSLKTYSITGIPSKGSDIFSIRSMISPECKFVRTLPGLGAGAF